jgi:hypothetical protein
MREFTDDEWKALVAKAEEIGAQHGKNKAEWWEQYTLGGMARGDEKEAARRVLRLLDEDMDQLNLPNDGMAGEYADDYTPNDLYHELEIEEEDDTDDTQLVTKYQDAFTAGVLHVAFGRARGILGLSVYVGPIGRAGDVAWERANEDKLGNFTCSCCGTANVPCTRQYKADAYDGFICEHCAVHADEEAGE